MIIDTEIRIGGQVLGEGEGITVTLFDASHPHPCPYWGENSGLFFALANMKGKISIVKNSQAKMALEQEQAKLKQEFGRIDGNYQNVRVFMAAMARSFILQASSWSFDQKTDVWTYNLF